MFLCHAKRQRALSKKNAGINTLRAVTVRGSLDLETHVVRVSYSFIYCYIKQNVPSTRIIHFFDCNVLFKTKQIGFRLLRAIAMNPHDITCETYRLLQQLM